MRAGFFRTAFYMPNMTPPVAVGILFLFLFNGTAGVVNRGLEAIGIPGPFWTTDPSWVKPGLALMGAWSVGGTMVIYLAALKGVPQQLYEAAAIDGASAWRRFRTITLPMISPALYFTGLILTIAGLQSFAEAYTAFYGTPGGDDGQRRGALLRHLPLPAGLPVPLHGLRVGDGVAPLRRDPDRDGGAGAGHEALRLLLRRPMTTRSAEVTSAQVPPIAGARSRLAWPRRPAMRGARSIS